MTLCSAAHEVLRSTWSFSKIMLIGAVLPIAAVSLLAFVN